MATIINSSTDFSSNALADLGVTVVRTPVTLSYTSNGDEIRTNGTNANITAVFHKRQPNYIQTEEGLIKQVMGYVMVDSTTTLNRGDIITYQSEGYRVESVITRSPAGSIAMYKYAEIILIE